MPYAWTLRELHDRQVRVGLAALALIVTAPIIILAAFGAFSWPNHVPPSSKVYVGKVDRFVAGQPTYYPDQKFWLVREPDGSFLALYAKDPKEGCTVPWRSSFNLPDPVYGSPRLGWFRNPCGGQTYDLQGRCVSGPCLRGLDRYKVELIDGNVWVDTAKVIQGPPR